MFDRHIPSYIFKLVSNHMHWKERDMITHPWHKVNVSLVTPPLRVLMQNYYPHKMNVIPHNASNYSETMSIKEDTRK